MATEKYTAILAIKEIDEITVSEARKRFFLYKDQHIITGGLFDDDCWILCDEYSHVHLDFSIDRKKYRDFKNCTGIGEAELKEYLKAYIICQMGELVLLTMQRTINCVKRVIYFREDFKSLADSFDGTLLSRVAEFFSMLPNNDEYLGLDDMLDLLDDIEDTVRTTTGPGNGQRTLASFESYFRFNELLDRFWGEGSDRETKLFFFPIWLWWHVSGVLPLRPREFILTPRKCLTKKSGKYYLTIRRSMIKGSRKKKSYKIISDYKKEDYEIPEELAEEIQWYLNETADYPDTDINTLFIPDVHYRQWDRSRPINSRFFTYVNLRTCLRYFYEQIVQNRYGYRVILDRSKARLTDDKEIEYLHLGDTRHIALINLIAEGATPVIAMVLAGHDDTDMSSHYYSNIATMVECQTYRQYKKMIKGQQNYSLSLPQSKMAVGDYTLLGDNSRCFSARVRCGDYSDCCKAVGPAGEMGWCETCSYHRANGSPFKDSSSLYRNRIFMECEALSEIVKKVRNGKGKQEDLITTLLKLKDTEYSYKQYLLETMEEEDYGKTEIDHNGRTDPTL